MHVLKNATTNLTAAHINQMASNDHVNEERWDDAIIRKKCLTSKIVNNVNLLTMMSFGNDILNKLCEQKSLYFFANLVVFMFLNTRMAFFNLMLKIEKVICI